MHAVQFKWLKIAKKAGLHLGKIFYQGQLQFTLSINTI